MQMREVYSSAIDRIGYDPQTKELHVVWRRSAKGSSGGGRTSVYTNVPPDIAHRTMNSWSVGQAVRQLQASGDHEHSYAEESPDAA